MAGYRLAVDLGTTWTAAAVWRNDRVEVVELGARSASIPSVVLVDADGSVAVGDAAVRRALDAPERVVREVKRRVGDDAPVLVGGTPWAAELLLARVLRHVVDVVSAEQGGAPDLVVLTHPANWGRYKLDLLTQAARQVGVEPVTLVPEPVAAAAWYAAEHRVRDGGVVAVYDLGGGTFDAAVVRRSGDHFDLLGRPDGIERLGGIDIDAAVLGTVTDQLGDAWTTLDRSDPEVLADVAELRDRCVEAKEALSSDTAAAIPVRLPTARTTVRLTRSELEEKVRGPIAETVVALQRTITSAGLTPQDLDAVLLVGGASRMPLIAQEVSAALGVQVAVDANPKLAVASGAALLAGREATAPVPAPPPPEPPAVSLPTEPGPRRRWWIPVAAVGGAAALIAAAVLVLGGDDDDEGGGGDDDRAAVVREDADDGVLRIAVLAPDSGDIDFLSASYHAAAELAVEDVNGAGGALGGEIDVMVLDAGSIPDDGLTEAAFQEAVDAGADVIVGPAGDANAALIVDDVVSAGLVGCATAATAGGTLDGDEGRFVRVIGNEVLLAKGLAELIAADGSAHVAVLRSEATSSDYVDDVTQALNDAGVDVDLTAGYEEGDTDELVQELIDAAPDSVVMLGFGPAGDVISAAQAAGFANRWYGDDGMEFPEIAAGVEGDPTLVTGVTYAADPDGADDTVGDRIAERSGDILYGEYVYDCITLAAVAAEAAGTDGGDDLVEAMLESARNGESCTTVSCLGLAADGVDIDFEGTTGSLDFDDEGETPTLALDRYEYTADGTLAYVERLSVAA